MRVAAHFAGWLLGATHAETQTTGPERELLARHARGARRLVEIGVWHGVTTPARPIEDAGSVRAIREVVLADPAFAVVDAADSLTMLRRVH